jgi:hypothetical protein
MLNYSTIKRYKWAGELARIAMGKVKVFGEAPHDAAIDDPLAWWCLTEAIANPPKFSEPCYKRAKAPL